MVWKAEQHEWITGPGGVSIWVVPERYVVRYAARTVTVPTKISSRRQEFIDKLKALGGRATVRDMYPDETKNVRKGIANHMRTCPELRLTEEYKRYSRWDHARIWELV